MGNFLPNDIHAIAIRYPVSTNWFLKCKQKNSDFFRLKNQTQCVILNKKNWNHRLSKPVFSGLSRVLFSLKIWIMNKYLNVIKNLKENICLKIFDRNFTKKKKYGKKNKTTIWCRFSWNLREEKKTKFKIKF